MNRRDWLSRFIVLSNYNVIDFLMQETHKPPTTRLYESLEA